MKSTNFAKYISSFIKEYLSIERGYSRNTIRSYTDSFILLLNFLQQEKNIKLEKITVEILDKTIILEFLNWLKVSRESSDSSRNIRLAAIHSFFKYLSREELSYLGHCQSILSITFKKTAKKAVNYLSPEGIRLILSIPSVENKKGRRDLALLSLMYDTGARVQEIITLTPSMINLQKPFTVKVMGKGQKMRIIPVLNAQIFHLKNYMAENGLFDHNINLNPLFFNSRNEKLTRAGINYIVKRYVEKAREIEPSLIPKQVSCHTFRHSKAMHLLQAGVSLIYIRDILGHSSVITTEMYARADSRQKREALENAYINLGPPQSKSKWEGNYNLIEWLKSF
jgi:integrase/recombinase XerD